MQARDIERHLAQLGQELADRGVQKPIRVLMKRANGRASNALAVALALYVYVTIKVVQHET